MTRSKWIFTAMGLGILISVTAVSIYMPRMLEWYFEPPSTIGVSCSPSIAWAFHKFQLFQLAGVGVGALLGFLVGLKLTSNKNAQTAVKP